MLLAGYEFNNDNEPATTLWELPDGDSEGPGMNSRNHHMFSSVGAWLYKDLGGINQRWGGVDAGAIGFNHPVSADNTPPSALRIWSFSYRPLTSEVM